MPLNLTLLGIVINKLQFLNITYKKYYLICRLNIKQRMPNIKLVLHSVHFSRQHRSSHQRCSMKKGVLKNFAKLTGKYLCQSLFFIKVAGAACNFIKKEILAQVFSCGFCEISKNTLFTEHLWVTASGGKGNFETSL